MSSFNLQCCVRAFGILADDLSYVSFLVSPHGKICWLAWVFRELASPPSCLLTFFLLLFLCMIKTSPPRYCPHPAQAAGKPVLIVALAKVYWEASTEDNGHNHKNFLRTILCFSVRADEISFMAIPCSFVWTLHFCSIRMGVLNCPMKGKVVTGIKVSEIFIWQLCLIWLRMSFLCYCESYRCTTSPFIFPHLIQ